MRDKHIGVTVTAHLVDRESFDVRLGSLSLEEAILLYDPFQWDIPVTSSTHTPAAKQLVFGF